MINLFLCVLHFFVSHAWKPSPVTHNVGKLILQTLCTLVSYCIVEGIVVRLNQRLGQKRDLAPIRACNGPKLIFKPAFLVADFEQKTYGFVWPKERRHVLSESTIQIPELVYVELLILRCILESRDHWKLIIKICIIWTIYVVWFFFWHKDIKPSTWLV